MEKVLKLEKRFIWKHEHEANKMAGSNAQQLLIKQFDGNGFSNWEFRMKLILEQKEVLEVIKEEPPTAATESSQFRKRDAKARNIIVQCLSDNVLEIVEDKETAKNMMDTLRGTYLKKGISNQVQL